MCMCVMEASKHLSGADSIPYTLENLSPYLLILRTALDFRIASPCVCMTKSRLSLNVFLL